MSGIVVNANFWNSYVVQELRKICPKEERFRESEKINCDILFPFAGSIAFSVLYSEDMKEKGIQRIEKMARSFQTSIIIVCVSSDDSDLYGNFLMNVPTKITAVVCYPPEMFAKDSAEFIWKTAMNIKPMSRKFDKIVEEKRRLAMDPDYQAPLIFGAIIKNKEKRKEIIDVKTTRSETIRKTFLEQLPEILEKDFFLQPNE